MISNRIYWLDNEKNIFLTHEYFKCFYMFGTRFICCFLLDYWLSMEAIAFFFTFSICACNLVQKLLPGDGTSTVDTFHKLCAE